MVTIMNPKTNYHSIGVNRQTRLVIPLLLVFGSSGLLGCRSTLPPEQPSRLWEVFGRQTGRYSPKSQPAMPAVHPEPGTMNPPVEYSTQPSVGAQPSGGIPQPSPGVRPDYGVSMRPNASASLPHPSSAMMIPPLPREVR